jgi:hypothetical protein
VVDCQRRKKVISFPEGGTNEEETACQDYRK